MSIRQEPMTWWQRVRWLFGFFKPSFTHRLTWMDDSPRHESRDEKSCSDCALGVPHTTRLHQQQVRKHELFKKTVDFSLPESERRFASDMLRAMEHAEAELKTDPWWA